MKAEKNHDFITVGQHIQRGGDCVKLQYHPHGGKYAWCVQYRGNCHYFQRKIDAVMYIRLRGFDWRYCSGEKKELVRYWCTITRDYGNDESGESMYQAIESANREYESEANEVEDEDTFAAADLLNKEFPAQDPKTLADRLDMCGSYVTKDGDWKYDRVPVELVMDLLQYLRTEEKI